MQEEEYVETSDAEELGDVYGPARAPLDDDARMVLVYGRTLISEENSQECNTPRKRRKVCEFVYLWNYTKVYFSSVILLMDLGLGCKLVSHKDL